MSDLDYQTMFTAKTTYHEIRHALQYKRQDLFTDLEQFLIQYLSDYSNLCFFSRKAHDSLYNEIDANLYAAQKSKLLFKDNKQIFSYFEKKENELCFKKETYDFEMFFDRFINTIKKYKFNDGYDENEFIQTYWNKNGTFKNIAEITSNPNFDANDKVSVMILGSDRFLSEVSTKDLSLEEIDSVLYEIQLNKYIQNQKKENINKMFETGKIDKKNHDTAVKKIDELIARKEFFEESIKNRKIINSEAEINNGATKK